MELINVEVDMLTCSRCECEKDESKFQAIPSRKKGYSYWCRDCINSYNRIRRKTKVGLIKQIYTSQKSVSKQRGMSLPDYSLDELMSWVLSQELYHKLHDEWVESGHNKDKTPSIDRINDYESYTMSNIQLMTFRDNYLKVAIDKIEYRNNKQCVPVVITFNGVDTEYVSITAASRELNIPIGTLCCAAQKGNIVHEKYYIRYKNI